MLHEVMIDGIKYVPQATIQPQDDETLRRALHELVSLHYFGNWHKAKGVTGLVIEMLSRNNYAIKWLRENRPELVHAATVTVQEGIRLSK